MIDKNKKNCRHLIPCCDSVANLVGKTTLSDSELINMHCTCVGRNTQLSSKSKNQLYKELLQIKEAQNLFKKTIFDIDKRIKTIENQLK